MYKKFSSLKKHHQFLYSLFIGIGLISFWRGSWLLMDLLLFPNAIFVSALSSVLIGVVIMAITHHKLG